MKKDTSKNRNYSEKGAVIIRFPLEKRMAQIRGQSSLGQKFVDGFRLPLKEDSSPTKKK